MSPTPRQRAPPPNVPNPPIIASMQTFTLLSDTYRPPCPSWSNFLGPSDRSQSCPLPDNSLTHSMARPCSASSFPPFASFEATFSARTSLRSIFRGRPTPQPPWPSTSRQVPKVTVSCTQQIFILSSVPHPLVIDRVLSSVPRVYAVCFRAVPPVPLHVY